MKKTFMLAFLIFLASCTNSSSEEIRKPAVAGAFYPRDKEELAKTIQRFLDNVTKLDIKGDILAIVVPHAGYIYSGQVASYAYKQLEGLDINSVVLICNSHTAYFPGIAIDESDMWQTPLGVVEVDKKLASKLVEADEVIQYNAAVHKNDHTLEVQVPFLQILLGEDFKIVPILFGNRDDDMYKQLAQALAHNLGKDDIIIISTDMSHYPQYEDANRIDQGTLDIIKEKDVSKLEDYIREVENQNIPQEQTLLCGVNGVKTMIELSNILGDTNFEILKYANSGDVVVGDKSRVVGYSSIVISKETKGDTTMSEEYLNNEEKKKLLKIARASIVETVTRKEEPQVEVTEKRLLENRGAFVTINKEGQLRGCIGYIIGVKPLHETVREVAKSAAVNDFRFSPVSKDELDKIEVEVSALTPLKRISSIDEIEVGKHGLYMRRSFNSGLLLPQVATEYNWDRQTFLQHTCLKAGLPKDSWKDKSTEIYTFSAEVFSEEDAE